MAAEAAVSKIVESFVDAAVNGVVKHVGYILNYKENMAYLNRELTKLDNERSDIESRVIGADNNAERIRKGVPSWQKGTDQIIEEAKLIIEEWEKKGKNKCLRELCPNLVSRYKLSRRACKKAADVGVAITEAEKFKQVSDLVLEQNTTMLSTEGCFAFESRKPILEDIIKALQDETMDLIGLYGFGGMGKTTLAKQVASRAREEKKFEEVVFASITQKVNMMEMQGQIASMLGLKLEESTVAERANHIYARLKKKKVLVILDDLWEALDLKQVGIPCGGDHMSCKIVLTSRSRSVLASMETKREFLLGALDDEESWKLFEKKATRVVKEPAFLAIGKEVAKRCAGLPVLIVTVAASLSKRPNLNAWKDALTQLKKKKNKEMDEIIDSAMRAIAYKHLEKTHKRLFLLCGVIGGEAFVEDVLKYSFGWNLFDEEGVVALEDARNRLDSLILDLKESCLLLDGNDEKCIKMHDVVRDAAISIARKDQNMFSMHDEWIGWLKNDVLRRCTAMVFNDLRTLPSFPGRLEGPNLELFILYGFFLDSNPPIPNTFFEGTKKLKVLDMTALSISALPSSLSFLQNLQSLHLDYCRGLEDISIIGELKKLQVLTFVGSDIQELPSSLGQLSELKLLDLDCCSQLEVIPAGLIAGLSQLQELHMSKSFDKWEAKKCIGGSDISKASLMELKDLKNLNSLRIEVPDAGLVVEDLNFEKWNRYEVIVGGMWDGSCREWLDELGITRIIGLQLNNKSINHLQRGINELFKRTEALCLGKVKGIKNVIPELDENGFPDLKHLRIEEDLETRYIVNVEDKQHTVSFPALESLYVIGLLKLEKLCKGQLVEKSLYSLTTVEVEDCDKLESLFSLSMATRLKRLQEIKVTECDILEEIVAREDGNDDNTIYGSLKKEPHSVPIFQNLRKVNVWECKSLRYVFPPSVSFNQLEELFIKDCTNLQTIIEGDENCEDLEEMVAQKPREKKI